MDHTLDQVEAAVAEEHVLRGEPSFVEPFQDRGFEEGVVESLGIAGDGLDVEAEEGGAG